MTSSLKMSSRYYRLTLPEYNESFVFVFSIEDAGRWVRGKKSPLTLACMQLLGPDDTYLVQVGIQTVRVNASASCIVTRK